MSVKMNTTDVNSPEETFFIKYMILRVNTVLDWGYIKAKKIHTVQKDNMHKNEK